MSITAVPLRPIKKGSLVKLWVALGALVAVGAGVAVAQTAVHGDTTASGLRFETLKAGKGAHPAAGDMVLVAYTGRLAATGKVFDSSEGRPTPLPVDGLIPGFTEGLKMMQEGGKYRLHIPSALGYGTAGAGPAGEIPPNADLEFDVDLQKIVPGAAAQMMGGPGGEPAGR
jgi:FKBP-type peptidyl-prolyl cis-trans isomerase FkpA